MTTVTLTSGQKMPLAGLGCWKIPLDETAKVVESALSTGYRLLDCACDYGNEVQVGAGIKAAIEKGTLKREELFVTSKLWCTYHAKEHVLPACKKTLKDLGLEYLDLYLIHFPIPLKYVDPKTRYPPGWTYDPEAKSEQQIGCEFVDVPISETWKAMENLVTLGLVKNIGVANFKNALTMDLLRYAKIKPAVNQVELHAYLQQAKLVQFCQRNGVQVTGYSNFGGASYIELGNDLAKSVTSLLVHEKIVSVAKKHKKSAAQVCLRFLVQQNIAVIPKSAKNNRLKENLDLFNFELDTEDMATLKAVNANIRFNDPGEFADYPIHD